MNFKPQCLQDSVPYSFPYILNAVNVENKTKKRKKQKQKHAETFQKIN